MTPYTPTTPSEIVPTFGDKSTKKIPLSNGMVVLVDRGDFDLVSKYNWFAIRDGNTWYARTSPQKNNVRTQIRMHRLILNAPEHLAVDHINGNGLDNRRQNIRLTTTRGNGQNLHIKKSSKYPGVRFHKAIRKWQSQIRIYGKQRHIGTFEREIDAFAAYSVACAVMGVTVVNQ